VLYRVHNIAGARLAFGPDHGCAFGNSPQGFAQIARPANKWDLERMLVDVMSFIGRS
jgi:hypothetical protein